MTVLYEGDLKGHAHRLVAEGQGLPEVLAQLEEHAQTPEQASKAFAEALRAVAATTHPESLIAGASAFDPQPMDLTTLDELPPPPDWIVHGVLERGTVGIFSGDTGAAKSIMTQRLAAAIARGEDWFERKVNAERVLIVDEENPDGLVRARLRGMGMRGVHGESVRYFNREGFSLGSDPGDAEFVRQVEEFAPDLVVIDTLMSTTGVDVNDNVAAVKTMKWFRALARDHGCGVLILHHERKTQKDGPASGSSQQSMGARQWTGQADAMLTTATETEMKREELENGHFKLRRTFKVKLAEKDRDGRLNTHRRVAVESEKDAHERLLWMTVEDEGEIVSETAAEDDERSILTALSAGHWMGRMAVATKTGEPKPAAPSGTWKTALKATVTNGYVESEKQKYRITQDGRQRLTDLGLPV